MSSSRALYYCNVSSHFSRKEDVVDEIKLRDRRKTVKKEMTARHKDSTEKIRHKLGAANIHLML